MTRHAPYLIVASLFIFVLRGEAHKPITSKYTYTEDVFPILNSRCGSCHFNGGIAPMSLLTYKDTIPWAESMRQELTANHMPPWYTPDDRHRLSSRELDILLTWATGGTPEGPMKRLTPSSIKAGWKLGKPDLVLPMPSAFTVAADTMEETKDFLLRSPGQTDHWIRALDVLPGTAAVVRDVTVYTKAAEHEDTLASWFPGDTPAAMPANTALHWPAGSELRARIHYRKTWTYDGKPVTDRTTVGVYLLNHRPQHEIRSWAASQDASTLQHDVEVVTVRLDGGSKDEKVQVVAVRPNGSRVDLIRLISRADWNRRYWLPEMVSLPKGSRIDVTGATDVQAWLDVIEEN